MNNEYKKRKTIVAILASALFISLVTNFHYNNEITKLRETLIISHEQINELDYNFKLCKFLLDKRYDR